MRITCGQHIRIKLGSLGKAKVLKTAPTVVGKKYCDVSLVELKGLGLMPSKPEINHGRPKTHAPHIHESRVG